VTRRLKDGDRVGSPLRFELKRTGKTVPLCDKEQDALSWSYALSFQPRALVCDREPLSPQKQEALSNTCPEKSRRIVDRTRVLLADDNETILARVRNVLGEEFEIVGCVQNGRDAIAAVRRLDPDVLLIDISMPTLDGLQAVSRLGSNLRTKVVFLTVHEDQDFVDAAFAAGASAYVAKSDVTTDLIPAIHEALEGRKYISKSIAP
jgi:CheY-like chemotaxis protein